MFDVEKHTIYKIRHGSHAYGCNIEGSDEDFKGVAIAPLDYYLGPFLKFEQLEMMANKGHPYDQVIYDVQKFILLAANNNPNILEMLFVDPSDIISINKIGELLLSHRDDFVCKEVYKSFTGYAVSQIKRIRTHRKWLLNPPTKKPERSDFMLSETAKITPSEMGAYDALLKKGEEELPINVMELIAREKRYAGAKREWDQYCSWKENRNEKRAATEAAFGFDSKHGYHLVRLARMGVEILEGKGVIVRRPDAEELIAIRSGAWTFEQIEEWFAAQEVKLETALANSKLKDSVDTAKLNELCVKLIQMSISS